MNSPWTRTDPNRKSVTVRQGHFFCGLCPGVHQPQTAHVASCRPGGVSWGQISEEDILPLLVAERLPTPEHCWFPSVTWFLTFSVFKFLAYVVWLYETVNQVQLQEEAEEKLKKTKCIILTGPRDWRHTTRVSLTNTRVSGGRRQEPGQSVGRVLYWGSCGKSKPGRKALRVSCFE